MGFYIMYNYIGVKCLKKPSLFLLWLVFMKFSSVGADFTEEGKLEYSVKNPLSTGQTNSTHGRDQLYSHEFHIFEASNQAIKITRRLYWLPLAVDTTMALRCIRYMWFLRMLLKCSAHNQWNVKRTWKHLATLSNNMIEHKLIISGIFTYSGFPLFLFLFLFSKKVFFLFFCYYFFR